MASQSHFKKKKTRSQELSEDFDLIVNEINDFIAILEEQGHKPSEPLPLDTGQIEPDLDSESSSLSLSPRNTVIHIEDTDLFLQHQENSEPIYESFDEVQECPYESIQNVRPKPKAIATANLIPQAYKPIPKPKPLNLRRMGEPGNPPKRVKAIHNYKGTNNDEVSCHNWFNYIFLKEDHYLLLLIIKLILVQSNFENVQILYFLLDFHIVA